MSAKSIDGFSQRTAERRGEEMKRDEMTRKRDEKDGVAAHQLQSATVISV